MKTIGYLLPSFPDLSQPEIGDEIRAMQARGHHVVVMIGQIGAGQGEPEDMLIAAMAHAPANVRAAMTRAIFRRPGRTAHRALAFILAQKKLPRHELLQAGLRIASLAREFGCDHLHVHHAGAMTAEAIVAARWIGITVSFTAHGADVLSHPVDLSAKLAYVDLAIGPSAEIVKAMEAYKPQAEMALIAGGVSPERFLPSLKTRSNGRLIHFGALTPTNGVDDLIEAARRLGDACPPIDVADDGPLAAALRKRADEHGLTDRSVHFLGAVSTSWIIANAPAYQAVILPYKNTTTDTAPTDPLNVKQAMAMGLPVVTTRIGGIAAMVDQAGLLVEPGNVAALANAMKTVAGLDERTRQALGRKARSHIQGRYALDLQARALSGLIELIKSERAARSNRKAA